MAKNKTKIALEFDLDGQDQEVLTTAAGPAGILSFLKGCIEAYLHEYASGGLLLTGQEVARIGKTMNKAVSSSEEIIEAVDKGQKQNKGLKVVSVTIDPSIADSLRDNAYVQGISVDELIHQYWGHIMANEWLGQINTDVTWVPLSKDLAEYVRTATSESVITSLSLVKALKKAA